ncbi:MAG: alpha/beta hydrolase family protein [Bacteroidota bacterium]
MRYTYCLNSVLRWALLGIFTWGACSGTYSAEVDTVYVYSPSMGKLIPNLVILPDAYDSAPNGLAVVYLLHGAGGDYTQWVSVSPELPAYADQYGVIVVCPDGGLTSWYLDSPVDSTQKYGTYLSEELVTWVDAHICTRPDRAQRAISGLSMGGHGALLAAIRYPQTWGAVGSTSGGVDIRPFPHNWDLPLRLGPADQFPQHWEAHSVLAQAARLSNNDFALYVDCGTEDFFLKANRSFHQRLTRLGIPHVYEEFPGAHNGLYWRKALPRHLAFFDQFFNP